MAKVICPGEVLIDFISLENGKKLVDVEKFQKKAGGAPANVATALVKLGASAEFVGAVGKDSFGKFLIETLEHYKVGTSHVIEDPNLGTTIAYVSIDEDGERDFEFMRGADGNISPEQANSIQSYFNQLEVNYQRILYCRYLYNLPPKFIQKLQKKKIEKELKKYVDNKADEESVKKENQECLDKVKEEING